MAAWTSPPHETGMPPGIRNPPCEALASLDGLRQTGNENSTSDALVSLICSASSIRSLSWSQVSKLVALSRIREGIGHVFDVSYRLGSSIPVAQGRANDVLPDDLELSIAVE